MKFFQYAMVEKNLIRVLSTLISMTVASFIDFETRSVILFKDKVSKKAPKGPKT